MTREEKIKEIQHYLWNEVEGYDLTWEADCDKLAEKLYEDSWCKQIEAEWIPIDRYLENFKCWAVIGYTCSNCKTEVQEYTNYCAYCGARMEVRDKV